MAFRTPWCFSAYGNAYVVLLSLQNNAAGFLLPRVDRGDDDDTKSTNTIGANMKHVGTKNADSKGAASMVLTQTRPGSVASQRDSETLELGVG